MKALAKREGGAALLARALCRESFVQDAGKAKCAPPWPVRRLR